MVEKKKFFPVQIPILNKEIELLAMNSEDLEGRYVKMDLTNTLKGKGLEIKFKVVEEEGKITAIPLEAYLQGFYIRRMLRKGTDYVEDSFLAECKDHRIRIKPFLITRKRVSRRVLKGLREKAKEKIIKYIKEKEFDILVSDIMNGKFQKEINPALKKIYPLGLCEIRFIGIEDLKEHEKYEEEQKAKDSKDVEEPKEKKVEEREIEEEPIKKSTSKVKDKEEKDDTTDTSSDKA